MTRKSALPNLRELSGKDIDSEVEVGVAVADLPIDDDDAGAIESAPTPKIKAPSRVKYRRIRLHDRTNPMEPEAPFISVNGDGFQVQRGVDVVLSENYLQMIRDAIIEIPSSQPDAEGRAGIIRQQRFTFDDLGPATEEQFRKLLLEGAFQRDAKRVNSNGSAVG